MNEPNPKVCAHSGSLTKARKPGLEGDAVPSTPQPPPSRGSPARGWEGGGGGQKTFQIGEGEAFELDLEPPPWESKSGETLG